jgi:hypothetical protein
MKVIKNLFNADQGFGPSHGWTLGIWERELTIKHKSKWITSVHKVHYIIHRETGIVMTSQVKAWNDTVRMCMWLDLVMKPIMDRDGKMLIWMDNCGSHNTKAVSKRMGE